MQWRLAFRNKYDSLVEIADDTQNITSQVRRIFILEDPAQGSTELQERALQDLERLSCEKVKNVWSYMRDYRRLAALSGRSYLPDTSDKFFKKLPPAIGPTIEKSQLDSLCSGCLLLIIVMRASKSPNH